MNIMRFEFKLILFPLFIWQYETRKEGEVVLAGANASEEDADEGTDESSVSGIGKLEFFFRETYKK